MGQVAGLNFRHSGSALCAYDFDQDGDKDMLLGDLASPGIINLTNGGSASQAWMTASESGFPSNNIPVQIPYFVSPFMLDINHDGIDDFVAGSNFTGFSENVDVAWYYINNGNSNFNLQETGLFVSDMLDFGSVSKPTFFDYNADGKIDILIGTSGYFTTEGKWDPRLILLENTGTAESPQFVVADGDYLGFSAYASVPNWEFAPAAGDLDGDGDTDLLIGDRNGQLFYLENTAGPGNQAVYATPVYPYQDIAVGSTSTPVLIDLNGDALLDIVCGERLGNNDTGGRCSNLNYFQNVGSVGNPQFIADVAQAPNTQCFGRVLFGLTPGIPDHSAPAFAQTPMACAW
jgi:hypothetical protein